MEISQVNVHKVIWFGQSYAKRLGLWGVLGLIMTVVSLSFYLIKVPELKQFIKTARIEQTNQRKKNTNITKQEKGEKPKNTEDEIAKFYARFPTVNALPKVLSELNNIAKKQSIELEVGDYKLNDLKTTKVFDKHELTRYEITYPMKGPYTHIRSFITESLKTFPEIALEDLQVVRDGSTSAQVEATLIFAVYVKVGA